MLSSLKQIPLSCRACHISSPQKKTVFKGKKKSKLESVDRREEQEENALDLPYPSRKMTRLEKVASPAGGMSRPLGRPWEDFSIFLMFSRRPGLMENKCRNWPKKVRSGSFPLKTAQKTRTRGSVWLPLGLVDCALSCKIYSARGSDHGWSPLPSAGPQRPGRQAEGSCFPSFKVLRLKSSSNPFIR